MKEIILNFVKNWEGIDVMDFFGNLAILTFALVVTVTIISKILRKFWVVLRPTGFFSKEASDMYVPYIPIVENIVENSDEELDKITPDSIQKTCFTVRFRGFDVDEVYDFMQEVSLKLKKVIKENERLKTQLAQKR